MPFFFIYVIGLFLGLDPLAWRTSRYVMIFTGILETKGLHKGVNQGVQYTTIIQLFKRHPV